MQILQGIAVSPGLAIGEVITISSVNLPSGTRPTIDRDFVIANISAPRGLSDTSEEVIAEDAGITTGETAEE